MPARVRIASPAFAFMKGDKMKKGPESKEIIKAVVSAKKAGKNKSIWKRVSKLLLSPRRKRIAVNVSKISKHTSNGQTAVVPGKVLGIGDLDHKVDVVALSFSESAKEKIKKSGGKTILLSSVPAEGIRTEMVLIR